MVKLEYIITSNGFIKNSSDSNHNGMQTSIKECKVYTYPNTTDDVCVIVEDFLNDLGLSLDNGDEKIRLEPIVEKSFEIIEAIEYHKAELARLKKLLKSEQTIQ